MPWQLSTPEFARSLPAFFTSDIILILMNINRRNRTGPAPAKIAGRQYLPICGKMLLWAGEFFFVIIWLQRAWVVEPVDTGDLKSPGLIARAGSSPAPGTNHFKQLCHGNGRMGLLEILPGRAVSRQIWANLGPKVSPKVSPQILTNVMKIDFFTTTACEHPNSSKNYKLRICFLPFWIARKAEICNYRMWL